MIDTNTLDKADFVRAILERDIRNIFRAQALIVNSRKYISGKQLEVKKKKKGVERRTGLLANALDSPNFMMRSQGSEFLTQANYPLYIRFLDMKSKGNLQVYNRQIWGILYNNAYPDIRFRYGQEIRDRVGDALREAFNPTKK